MFGFQKRPRNFVIAMGVFGNSNSLPISLVLSLSQTIKGLHWDKIPGDNDDEVGARGILYLLIFQQLGQLVRWSWGYNVLLAPADKFEDTVENNNARLEDGSIVRDERQALLDDSEEESEDASGSEGTRVERGDGVHKRVSDSQLDVESQDGGLTPDTPRQNLSLASSSQSIDATVQRTAPVPEILPTPLNGNANGNAKLATYIESFPSIQPVAEPDEEAVPPGLMHYPVRSRNAVKRGIRVASESGSILLKQISDTATMMFAALPPTAQKALRNVYHCVTRFFLGVWSFMNPPLWAMLAAIVVASIPQLQSFFFADGTFFKNSVTSAVRQSGGVAVPLILVVLGANLARNTLPNEEHTKEDAKEETKLLVAALISRMLLPTLVMAPLLALTAKFVPVSILDDPIFVIVCFLITGAPSALQLAQICQINNVYMGAMSRLLFQSYVVWILPSTLVLVMCALEVVEWAQQ